MIAVAGVFGASRGAGAAAREDVERMLDRMPLRSAGARIVSPTPSSGATAVIGAAGRAPAAHDEPGVACLAGDIRLDNRRELRTALDLESGASDARIALAAYLRWGDGFARALAGDFAFLILDHRSGRGLAVRDHLGLRPLHYRAGASGVRVASELCALIEPGDAVDEGFLAEALGGDIVDVEATPYMAIRRVPAAHVLLSGDGPTRLLRYWEPSTSINAGSPADHAARLRDVFDEAVRARCDGLERAGLHLSGGLDSSSVLGSVMANAYAAPVAAALLLPWPEADERAWIEAAAARWAIAPMYVAPPTSPAAHDLAAIAAHRDLPDFPTGAPLLAPLHHALRGAGVTTALTGFGGDQWWSGETAHMADLLRRLDIGALRRWRRAGSAMGMAEWTWEAFVASGVLPLVPGPLKRAVRRVRPARAPSWIDARFAARVSLVDRLRVRPDTTGAPSESWRRRRWRLGSGEEAVTRERLDRMAVAHGIELRHPFYDRRLVELAFATPEHARLDGQNRRILRDAMADRLAPQTRRRETKAEVSRVLLAAAGAPDVAPHLALPRLTALGWIDRPAAAALVHAVRDEGDAASASAFWSVIGVEAWLAGAFQ